MNREIDPASERAVRIAEIAVRYGWAVLTISAVSLWAALLSAAS